MSISSGGLFRYLTATTTIPVVDTKWELHLIKPHSLIRTPQFNWMNQFSLLTKTTPIFSSSDAILFRHSSDLARDGIIASCNRHEDP